ncbi:hypothetical protein [Streptomyces sp. IBSBF 2435]|uniref:hypothetical protein n=1 Tax=Streptomyces sp. IBSBF 2435 TaxID=2903531 RepID=UPI002FDC439A
MPAAQMIVVSLPGSGTPLLADITSALGYASYGTMSGGPSAGAQQPGPGEVYPLLRAAYGAEHAAALLNPNGACRKSLEPAFQQAVSALWRVWWTRLGQPTTHASPVDPDAGHRLARLPATDLLGLLPGRGCWYVTGLDLRRADPGFLSAWRSGGRPPIVLHDRDIRDRIISQIRALTHPAGQVGSLPEHLVYRDILTALPTLEARITLALTDPGFPGTHEARGSRWLRHHPAVCAVTHEELAGPAAACEQALGRLLRATGRPNTAEVVADLTQLTTNSPADPATGTGRTLFTPEHERLLRHHHGDLLPPGPPTDVPAAHAEEMT